MCECRQPVVRTNHFRGAIMDAVEAAAIRAAELGKKVEQNE